MVGVCHPPMNRINTKLIIKNRCVGKAIIWNISHTFDWIGSWFIDVDPHSWYTCLYTCRYWMQLTPFNIESSCQMTLMNYWRTDPTLTPEWPPKHLPIWYVCRCLVILLLNLVITVLSPPLPWWIYRKPLFVTGIHQLT